MSWVGAILCQDRPNTLVKQSATFFVFVYRHNTALKTGGIGGMLVGRKGNCIITSIFSQPHQIFGPSAVPEQSLSLAKQFRAKGV